ncbi:single-strand DNA-binding protein [Nocardioides salarius]|uniref:Single-strand DNA-binding protein n=1 Tax=Nocardioides salarius TaxID=374513 RepID=A0ABS2M5C8_9ACTN|nr:single-stranded DNA-binding protein [Nocardioides salarius]MBM7506396.1 single-strand DNA-binding protein [Nocardioides salarius]
MPTKEQSEDREAVNEVRLQGRLAQDPQLRELPSGDRLWTFRVVVGRPPRPAQADGRGPRGAVDAIECAVWDARVRRSVERWHAGDVVAVEGAVRRRFFRSGAGTASRVEIEVRSGRRLRRAPGA